MGGFTPKISPSHSRAGCTESVRRFQRSRLVSWLCGRAGRSAAGGRLYWQVFRGLRDGRGRMLKSRYGKQHHWSSSVTALGAGGWCRDLSLGLVVPLPLQPCSCSPSSLHSHSPSPPPLLFFFFLNRKSHHQHVGRNTQICKQPFLYRVSHSAPCHPEDLGGSCLQHKMSGTREGCSFFRGLEMPGLLHGSHSPDGHERWSWLAAEVGRAEVAGAEGGAPAFGTS